MADTEDTPIMDATNPEAGDNVKENEGKVDENVESASKEEVDNPKEQAGPDPEDTREKVSFKVIFNKQKLDITFPLDDTVIKFKSHLEGLTKVPPSMQKLMFKGKLNDDTTLRDANITKSSKVMLIGSTVNDVMTVAAPDPKALKEEMLKEEAASKEPISTQKPHKAVLEKHGKPDDVMMGVKKKKEPLPPCPISGMYNKSGGKVRLTFKLDQDQLWIGTKERTDKIPLGSIKAVVSETLEGHEEYHIMGIQLGTTEASRYWIYWGPAQYVEAIKDAILGKWQLF